MTWQNHVIMAQRVHPLVVLLTPPQWTRHLVGCPLRLRLLLRRWLKAMPS